VLSLRCQTATLYFIPPRDSGEGGPRTCAVGGAFTLKLLLTHQNFPHRPRPLHHASHGPPPLTRGRMQAISFSRCGPHPSHRHAVRISPLSAPIFARECRRWSPASHDQNFEPRNVRTEEKQGSGTPTDAYPTSAPCGVRRARSAARSPLGVPPRLCAIGTIHPKAQPGPGFVTHQLTRRVPRQPVWHFQRCTSRAGHSAGRLMPRPPGSGSDEPPRAGTASRPAMRGHRITSLYASEIDGHFSKPNRDVKAFLFVQINPDVAQGRFLLTRPQTHFTPTKIRRQRNCAYQSRVSGM
jgi:hypothetical protein